MHILDISIAVVFCGLVLWGMFKGAVGILLLFTGVVAGIIAARFWYAPLSGQIAVFIDSAWLPDLIAFAVIFLAVHLTVQLLGKALHGLLRVTATAWLDRLAGGLMGMILALSLVQGVRLLVALLPVPMDSLFADSRLWPAVLEFIDWCLAFLK